ncbi:MAG: restriction endonuclease [Flavobacterium sp.]|nr:MAG: restriction endonuclease [Flavobacterium sp.]
MLKGWYVFQEEIKDLFYKLGCDAKTNVTIEGIRTTHDVDIFVQSKFLGQNLRWILEAKHWSRRVSKIHVMALRQIVEDVGVDKGFIISQKGFQKGAVEAAKKTNILLLTFDELKAVSAGIFHHDILRSYFRRLNYITLRYYSHTKNIRIKYGLRQDAHVFNGEFDAFFIMSTISSCLNSGLQNDYPIEVNTFLNEKYGESVVDNFYQLINWLNSNMIIIEEKIFIAEMKMQQNGDFNPRIVFENEDENFHIRSMKIFGGHSNN